LGYAEDVGIGWSLSLIMPPATSGCYAGWYAALPHRWYWSPGHATPRRHSHGQVTTLIASSARSPLRWEDVESPHIARLRAGIADAATRQLPLRHMRYMLAAITTPPPH